MARIVHWCNGDLAVFGVIPDLEGLLTVISDPPAAVWGCVFEEELGKKWPSGIVQKIAEKTLAVV